MRGPGRVRFRVLSICRQKGDGTMAKRYDKVKRKAIIAAIDMMAVDQECLVAMLGEKQFRYQYAEAIVGTVESNRGFRVVYSASKVIEELMLINKWSHEDAVEWYEFNTVRGAQYIPEEHNPPIFMNEIVL